LQAGYQAIKAVDPTFLVGMYGMARPSLAHVQAELSALRPYASFLDYLNFHYYAHGGDPAVSTNDHPSFAAEWRLMAQLLPGKPIWCTEVGWPISPLPGIQAVSPAVQAQYLQEVMTEAATSGVIQRVFWFTLNYGNQPDSIASNNQPLPAFATYQALVQVFPVWRQ
jgi:hypothetical protein